MPSVPFSLRQCRLGIDYKCRFSCGRGTGFNYLEKSQLVFGDKTELQPGIVFAVDGSVNASKIGHRSEIVSSLRKTAMYN